MAAQTGDEGLLAQVGARSRTAFERLVERHLSGLLRFAATLCASERDAEAAVREGLRAAWESGPPRTCASARAWLFKCVRQACPSAAAPLDPKHPSGEFLLALPCSEAPEPSEACQECARTREHLSDYLDGELARPDRAALEAHLAACPPCASLCDGLRLTIRFLHRRSATED